MYIYKTTNTINNKIYIGQYTGKKLDYLGSGSIFLKALKKYKRINFSKEILEYCSSMEELNKQEIYWIKYYNATDKKIGYNLSDGGSGTLGYKFTEEQKEKMSSSHKGLKQSGETIKKRQSKIKGLKRSDESRKNISIGLKKLYETREHPRLGEKHSAKTKRRIGEKNKKSLTGKKLTEEHKTNISIGYSNRKDKRPLYDKWLEKYGKKEADLKLAELTNNRVKKTSKIVLQIDINGIIINEFASVIEAMKETGFSRIIDVLKGRRNSTKGYIFKYKKQ